MSRDPQFPLCRYLDPYSLMQNCSCFQVRFLRWRSELYQVRALGCSCSLGLNNKFRSGLLDFVSGFWCMWHQSNGVPSCALVHPGNIAMSSWPFGRKLSGLGDLRAPRTRGDLVASTAQGIPDISLRGPYPNPTVAAMFAQEKPESTLQNMLFELHVEVFGPTGEDLKSESVSMFPGTCT